MVMSAALWATGSLSMAQNSVPYQDSFESYAIGSNLVGTVWQGVTNSAMAVITNGTPTAPSVGYPLHGIAHTQVMTFSDGPITNDFGASTIGMSVVAMDAMIQPTFADRPDGSQMVAVSNSQVSMYFDTNGLANIWLGTGAGWGKGSVGWLTFPQPTVLSGSWSRVTVILNYMSDIDLGDLVMMKVAINGNYLTNALGWSIPNSNGAPDGGPWFKAANWTDADARFHRVVLSGNGQLDDMVVTNAEMVLTSTNVVPLFATNWTSIAWMQGSGLATNGTYPTWDAVALADQDGDGVPTWAEFIAGTNPNDANSKLTIISQTISNGLPVLKWIGTTNAQAPYTIEWSSNLLSISAWTPAATNAQTEGTNILTIPSAPFAPAFMRIKINSTN